MHLNWEIESFFWVLHVCCLFFVGGGGWRISEEEVVVNGDKMTDMFLQFIF